MPTTHFIVRIEPHDSPFDNAGWSALDEAMTTAGFRAWVTGADRITYRLPAGEYHLSGETIPWDVLGQARRAAVAAGVQCSLVVAQTSAIVWFGLNRIPEAEPCE